MGRFVRFVNNTVDLADPGREGVQHLAHGTGTATGPPALSREGQGWCSPFDGVTRFAGTMELSGVNETLDRRQHAGIRAGIRRYLHDTVAEDEGIECVGMRPANLAPFDPVPAVMPLGDLSRSGIELEGTQFDPRRPRTRGDPPR
jgi:hypothetical protein